MRIARCVRSSLSIRLRILRPRAHLMSPWFGIRNKAQVGRRSGRSATAPDRFVASLGNLYVKRSLAFSSRIICDRDAIVFAIANNRLLLTGTLEFRFTGKFL